MSQAIFACDMIAAAKGDEAKLSALKMKMKHNVKHGAFTMLPCCHDPRCELPTEQQALDLLGEIPALWRFLTVKPR